MERRESDRKTVLLLPWAQMQRKKMNFATLQKIEEYKAKERIKFYLAGGSRPVFIGRNIIAGVVAVIWAFLWWRGY